MSRETPLLAEHQRAGAHTGVWFGTLLPSDYGDAGAEYRRGRVSAAVVDANFQLFAEFTGPDRVRYLNAITSGDILGLQPGRSAIGLLLTPQGHILAELRTLALDDRLLALSHAMTGPRTLETLNKFIIMDDVQLTDRTADFTAVAVTGPATEAVVEEFSGVRLAALPDGAHVETEAAGIRCRILRATPLGLPGAEFLVEREHLRELWRLLLETAGRHGGGAAGYSAINALRLEAGAAWFGTDFDDRVIPHEAGLEHSHISYTKGCYTGQEIVERVRSRGHANRRLIGLAFSGEALPEAGAKLTAEGKEAGWVTSAAFSPAAGRPIGMAYLRREFHQPGVRLRWQHGEAEVIALPLAPPAPAPSAGETGSA